MEKYRAKLEAEDFLILGLILGLKAAQASAANQPQASLPQLKEQELLVKVNDVLTTSVLLRIALENSL